MPSKSTIRIFTTGTIVLFPAYYWSFFRVSFILKPANCFNQSIGHLFCDKDRPLDSSPSKEGKKSMKNLARVSLCALAVSLFAGITVDAQNITTVAGGGPPATGTAFTATSASVGAPAAVRQDSSGNTYILDNDLGRVYKVDATGHLTLFAGSGLIAGTRTVAYNGNGILAVDAAMDGPSGMCIDKFNNVYVADSDNGLIREIVVTASTGKVVGNIYNVAGVQTETNFVYGGDGGPATSANLHFPDGCSFDSHGNMYIADRGNNEIRVVIAVVTGSTPVAPVGVPGPVTAGNIYRFAGGNDGNNVTQTPPTGGYGANGTPAITAPIYGPFDVFVDSHDNVFFADLGNNFPPAGPNKNPAPFNNNVIREVPSTTTVTPPMTAGDVYTVAGVPGVAGVGHTTTTSTTQVLATAALLNGPVGIYVDASGNLFFADRGNHVVREVPAATANGMIAGDIYDVAGNFPNRGYSGDGGAADAESLNSPSGTALDSMGNLLIADQVNDRARKVVPNAGDYATGIISTSAGNGFASFSNAATALAGQLDSPAGLAFDAAGDLAIADVGFQGELSLIRGVAHPIATGALSTLVGSPGFSGFANVTNTGFPNYVENNAIGVAFDSSGNLYIADTGNCIIRKLSAGVMTTVAGIEPTIDLANPPNSTPNCGFAAQGGAAVGTRLGAVNSVALDAAGDIFFSDVTNNMIWEVPKNTAGTMTAGNAYVIAGVQDTTGSFGGEAGAAVNAHFNKPTGISFDVYGNLFIADTGNNIIREIPADNTTGKTAGFIYTVAGDVAGQTAGYTGNGGVATAAKLNAPFTMVVDNAEDIFIADTNNDVIREVAGTTAGGKTAGDIYTVVGLNVSPVAGFAGDGGAATLAELNAPQGLALDGAGDLLIGDSQNIRVRSVAGIANVAAVPVASFRPSNLTFTAQPLTVKSTAQVVTLTNNGGATLTGIAITLGGTNAANFADTTTCTATLAAGANCTISVTFTPAVVGAASATLSIADNAVGSPQTIALSGTGQVGSPTDVVTPNPIAFTTPQLVGVASAALPVTLSNATGTGALVISSITFGGANTTDFTETNNCGTTVAAGATCTIDVVFDPTSVTPPARAATLTITDNAANSPISVPVTGTAIASAISITPTSLTFASQTVKTPSAPQTVTIKNTGTGPLSFSGTGITIAGANHADFTIPTPGDTCSAPLAAGATCSFNVVYNPAAAGPSTATIVVADSVPSSPQLIPLSGTATATPPALTLTLGAAAGGLTQTVTAGATATYMLQISANQNATVTFACTGAPTAATCTAPASATVTGGAAPAPVSVTVSTTARGMLAPQSEPATRMQPPVALQMLPLSVLAVLLLIITLLAATQSPAGRLRFARVALSACLVLMPIIAATLIGGCGGGSSSTPPPPVTGTPAGTYMITVTATSGSATPATTQLTLIVQ
jgi:sugar lactone lactonase YvrE